ncbi:MAG: glycosyl transferase [Ruminococcaceae bacterium]|nr:glycosyl transferase [Oscillospiraceae bacterium]
MIPKTIHYIWFGNRPKTKKIEKCINSWKQFCPDYKIIEWNETNFDFNSNRFAKEAYEAGNYAFVSDIARLIILYEYGGIYVDADVELLRNLDDLLDNDAFIGIETDLYVNSGQMFGTVKNNPLIMEHLEQYNNLSFSECEDITEITCPKLLTKLLIQKGFRTDGSEQIIDGLHIYPQDYFNPFDIRTGKMKLTENSYSIHWSAHSWASQSRLRKKITQICHRIFGVNCFNFIKKYID